MPRFSLFPENASTMAGQVDALFFFLIGVSAFFGILIAVLVVWLAIRYRRRGADAVGTPVHGMLSLEIVWTVIPFALAMVMFFWGARVYVGMARPPDDAHEIFVVGKQWMWKLQHLEGRREINELHVPVGQPIKLTMTSEDVIHSFFVPAFRIKADVVPGRYSTTWFEATQTGEYHLFCAEYCGTQHSHMIGRIVVMDPADFQDWLGGASGAPGAAPTSLADVGGRLFTQKGCISCHKGTAGAMGPSLNGLFGKQVRLADGGSAVADASYVRESILSPQAKIVAGYGPIMPIFQGQLSEEEVLALVQYIRSLGGDETEARDGE